MTENWCGPLILRETDPSDDLEPDPVLMEKY